VKLLFATLALIAFLVLSRNASAEAKAPVVIWPTLTPAGDSPGAGPLHKPQPTVDRNLFERAQDLDATLRDAVQDLGFVLYVADAGPAPGRTRDEDLLSRAARSPSGEEVEGGTWVVSPRLESAGGGAYMVRIVAVPPQGRELRVRVETVAPDSVSARGLVMLRDLLSPQAATQAEYEQVREEEERGSAQGIVRPVRSQGRAVLAVNAGLFGAFTAYSLQRASGSNDPRVLYPLLALGTGIGIGAALLVADEWDVTTGDAWFLSAGMWWGTASAAFIGQGLDVQPIDDRFAWTVGGGLLGLGLATFALTQGPMDDGDAMLAHSGGALGLLFGGATELLKQGSTTIATPYTGMGYGSAIGVLAAGALATQVTVSPSRVLLIDVGVGGGALVGAAAASPLIFKNPTESQTRAWLSATIGGSVVGGVAAWWLTRESWLGHHAWRWPGVPTAGVIGVSERRGVTAPAYGVGWVAPLW
jgi:hypothetical protein